MILGLLLMLFTGSGIASVIDPLDLTDYHNLKYRKDLVEIYRVANNYVETQIQCNFSSDLEEVIDDWARLYVETCNEKHKSCGSPDVYLHMVNGHWKAVEMNTDVWSLKNVPCFIWRGFTKEQCKQINK